MLSAAAATAGERPRYQRVAGKRRFKDDASQLTPLECMLENMNWAGLKANETGVSLSEARSFRLFALECARAAGKFCHPTLSAIMVKTVNDDSSELIGDASEATRRMALLLDRTGADIDGLAALARPAIDMASEDNT